VSNLVVATEWRHAGNRRLEAVKACERPDLDALAELVRTFLAYRGRAGSRTSPATLRTYRKGLERWVAWCWPDLEVSPDVPLLRATEDDVERFIAEVLATRSHSTAAVYRSAVRRFYDALQWAGALATNPAELVRVPADPTPRHERRPAMPVSWFRRVLAEASLVDHARSRRDVLLLHLLGSQGLRVSEAVALQLADLDLNGKRIHVRRGKGSKARTIPMTAHTRHALMSWRAARAALPRTPEVLVNVGTAVPERWLGRRMTDTTARRVLNALYRRAGVPERYHGAHTLRHTSGTRLYRATRDLHRVSQLLGHSHVDTSSIYAKMDDSGLEEAMALLDDDL